MRLAAILLFLSVVPVLGLDTIPTGYRLNNGGNVRIDAWGKCRDVSNASGRDHFIATRTQPEWWSFITATPSGLTDTTCPHLPEYTTSVHKVAPSGANGVTVAGNATAWADSAWVEVIASTAAAIVVTGVVVDPTVNAEFEIDIGRGTAGSEVVIATIPGVRKNGAGGPWWLQLPIPVDNIGAGQRVAIRFRRATTSATAFGFKLTYYEKPLAGGTMPVTAQPSKVMPSAATGVGVNPSGSAWVSGAWVQITAATANAIVLGGVTVQSAAGGEYELDIGTGTAGSETVITTFRDYSGNANGGPYLKLLKPALDNIPAGTRIAARIRHSATNAAAWEVKLLYYDSPVGVTLHDKALKWIPAASNGAAVTPSATAWADSSWVELIASASANLQLASFCLFVGNAANYEIEFGVGEAGSEAPIGHYKARPSNANLVDHSPVLFPLWNSIPVGSRLAVRLRKDGTNVTNWRVAAGYYEGSSASNKASAYHKGLPAAANALNVAPNTTAWANSAYVEYSAGVTEDILITAIGYDPPNNAEFEVDIATGAAGAETVRATLSGIVLNGGGNQIIALPYPLLVTAGTRVALRFRKENANATNWPFVINYVHMQ